jgi:enoyl-CoA hydratase/carnithine racemase
MGYEQITYQVEERILTLTLNRPDKLNAYTPTMQGELLDAINRADADDAVRAVIVTGAGRAFCAGADLSGGGATFYSSTDHSIEDYRDGGGQVVLRIFESKKPHRRHSGLPGVGITMTLPMDVHRPRPGGWAWPARQRPRRASARFPAWGSAAGRVIHRRASAGGSAGGRLVSRWYRALLDTAGAGAEIAENTSAVSVALSRAMFWRMLGADHPMEAHRIDSRAIYAMGLSPDAAEGVAAFLEKRSPRFPMRPSKDMPSFYPWWLERGFK